MRRGYVLLVLVLGIQSFTVANSIKCESNLAHGERVRSLEYFLVAQFDTEIELVRESPDESINRTYWLLSDNLFTYHALKSSQPQIADQIHGKMQEYGIFEDGLHESLFGDVIELPPYTPKTRVIDEGSDWTVKVEERSPGGGSELMNDWVDYADLLLYASLSSYNSGNNALALHYFTMAKDMWNGAGLYDKSTRSDGFYTTHKLALLLYASLKLNQTIPFREELENRIWMFQREDGGIRSHYLGDLTSGREANSETASLILLTYHYEAELQREQREVAIQKAKEKAQEERDRHFLYQVIVFVACIAIFGIAIALYKKGKIKVSPERKENLTTLVGLIGLLLYIISFRHIVALYLSLPKLPWGWRYELMAPFGYGDPARITIRKNPFFDILTLFANPLGIALIAYCMRRNAVRTSIMIASLLFLILIPFLVAILQAFLFSLVTEFG